MTADINHKKSIFLNTFFITVQTVIDKFLFIIINSLITHYLNPDLFGEYATALGYATVFSTFVDIGINATLVRSIRKDPGNEEAHVANAFFLMTIMAFISYGAMAFSLRFSPYNGEIVKLILIFGCVRIGNEYMKLFYAIYSAKERFIVQAVNNSLFSLLFLIATNGVIFFKGSSYDFAYSRLIIVIIFIITLAFYTLRKVKLKLKRSAIRIFIPQAFYFGLSSIYSNLYLRINIIILTFIHGSKEGGFFSNAFIIFSTMFFIPTNLSRVLVTHLYNYDYEQHKDKFQFAYDFYSKLLNIISVFIAMIFFIYSDFIITLMNGKDYLPASDILKITSLAIPLLFNVSGVMLTAIDKQKITANCQLIALIINVISNFILIVFYKGEGAAIATCITYLALNQLYMYYLKKNTAIKVYKTYKTILLLSIIAVLCFFLNGLIVKHLGIILSGLSISTMYAFYVYIFFVNKDDIRIVKETFFKR